MQWYDSFLKDAPWEALANIKTKYPELHFKDKVFVEKEESVMAHTDALMTQVRPKRNRVRLKCLKDYDYP